MPDKESEVVLAHYFATRTITMAVAAFIGVALASIPIWFVIVFIFNDPLGMSEVEVAASRIIIGFFGVGGFLWFVVLSLISMRSLRYHAYFHRRIP